MDARTALLGACTMIGITVGAIWGFGKPIFGGDFYAMRLPSLLGAFVGFAIGFLLNYILGW
jgi:hypothetical protein